MRTKTIRTDLAMEANELLQEKYNSGYQPPRTDGIVVEEMQQEELKVTRVKIVNAMGEKSVGKPIGNYITLEIPALRENNTLVMEASAKTLASELEGLCKSLGKIDTVLVVGLGNWNVTADALGPKVISKMLVTRHLTEYVPEEIDSELRPVCAIAPGVLGITGIETGEIVRGIVDRVHPSLVIAIDSLASRKTDRVSTTIQLSDTGITPGSGVGNKRAELSQAALGVPVIAIGVPTVIDAATMTNDAIDLVMHKLSQDAEKQNHFSHPFSPLGDSERHELIQGLLYPYIGNLVVTPKEIDEIIQRMANVIANALNMALQKAIGPEGINRYLH